MWLDESHIVGLWVLMLQMSECLGRRDSVNMTIFIVSFADSLLRSSTVGLSHSLQNRKQSEPESLCVSKEIRYHNEVSVTWNRRMLIIRIQLDY